MTLSDIKIAGEILSILKSKEKIEIENLATYLSTKGLFSGVTVENEKLAIISRVALVLISGRVVFMKPKHRLKLRMASADQTNEIPVELFMTSQDLSDELLALNAALQRLNTLSGTEPTYVSFILNLQDDLGFDYETSKDIIGNVLKILFQSDLIELLVNGNLNIKLS